MLIVINGVETTLGVGEARRICKELRDGAKRGVASPTSSAAALVVAEAITRGVRDSRMSRLVIREHGAIRALRAVLEARPHNLSEAEAHLLLATHAPPDAPPKIGREVVDHEAAEPG